MDYQECCDAHRINSLEQFRLIVGAHLEEAVGDHGLGVVEGLPVHGEGPRGGLRLLELGPPVPLEVDGVDERDPGADRDFSFTAISRISFIAQRVVFSAVIADAAMVTRLRTISALLLHRLTPGSCSIEWLVLVVL